MKLNRYIYVTLLVACLLLTGCVSHRYETDLDKKYASYWEYSLGSYTSTYETITRDDDGGITQTKYREYSFKFTDSKNRSREFSINNLKYDDSEHNNFEKKLGYIIDGYICSDPDVTSVLNDNSIKQLVESNGFRMNYATISCNTEHINNSISFQDDKRGVKISSLDLTNLGVNNIELTIKIDMSIYPEEGNYSNLKLDFENRLNSILKNSDYQNIKILFTAKKAGCYNDCKLWNDVLTYDGTNYNWKANTDE